MAQITSLVMENVQFYHFPIIVYGSFLLPWQPNQEADHQTFADFELSYTKQHLYQISPTASVVLEEISFKKKSIFFFKI